MTDLQVADSLNAEDRVLPNIINGSDLKAATDAGEISAVPVAQLSLIKQLYDSSGLDASAGSVDRAMAGEAFAGMASTIAALAAIPQTVTKSRAAELGLRVVVEAEVNGARSWQGGLP